MTNPETRSKISCGIRCVEPADVDVVSGRLDSGGVEWFPYTCKLSGEKESILMVGDGLAYDIMKSLPYEVDLAGAKILACLYSAELCECDIATVTRVAENEVITQLEKFTSAEMIEHHVIQGMNYYRLKSGSVQQSIKTVVENSETGNH